MQRRPCWPSCPRFAVPSTLPVLDSTPLHVTPVQPLVASALASAPLLPRHHTCCRPGCRLQVGGYTVLEVSVDLQTVCVMEGLTEDAVYARIYEGGQLTKH